MLDEVCPVSALISQDFVQDEDRISSAHTGTVDRAGFVVDLEGASQNANFSMKSLHSESIDIMLDLDGF